MSIRERLNFDKDIIVSRIKNGESTSSIAKTYSCNAGTVWYFLKSINIEPNTKRSKNYGNVELRKEEIVNLFNSGMSAWKISIELNISKPVIIKKLNEWGYDLSSKRKDNPENMLKNKLETVKSLFEAGNGCEEIARQLGHSGASVMKLLNKHGYDTSDWKYHVDETFFNKIDTEEKAYVLGWMYSDGNVRNDGKWRISIAITDEEILLKIKDIIKYDGPLYYKIKEGNRERQVELCVNRKCMVNDLIKLGCVPAKSLILTLPNYDQVPENLFHHFIRGVFDGDGSVYNGVTICGSYDFTHELAKILPCKITNIYQRYKRKNIRESAHQLFIGRQEEIKKFSDWLYKDSTIYLERKKNKFIFGV